MGNFSTTMRNSLILVVGTRGRRLIFGGMAAYALAHCNCQGAVS